VAEDLNLVATIDRLILERALSDLRSWRAKGLDIPRLSVNVSARRIRDGELIDGLKGMDIPRGVLAFELVESIFLDEQDEMLAWNVDKIKDMGIEIEIDDFGTGYASIVGLQKLKPTRLKIDRQLTMPIVSSSAQRKMFGSIIEIGKSLGIEIVAEGVETMAHAMILQTLGCDYLQGYALARPMPAEQIAKIALDAAALTA
jgi:EAL domain-containing protein (putative c-di-GMP-specific phosphodiesterase class I)